MSKVELHLAALAAAGAGAFVADQAQAAVVYSGIQNLSVPATFDGLYLNMVAGNTGSLGSSTPGWDIDPWVSGGTWRLFNVGSNGTGGVVGAGSAASNLAMGTPIGAASTFLTPAATSVPTGNNVIMGIRLFNENTSAIHYGWVRMSNVVNPATAPATIVDWAYESVAGANINAGDGIPTPGAASLLAIGAAGLVGRRRRA